MNILDELNNYYKLNENSLDEFQYKFRDNWYHHDYVESLFEFLRHLESIQKDR